MFRLLVIIAAIYLLYRILTSKKKAPRPQPGRPPEIEDEMIQDPYCGTYFPKSQGVPGKVNGQRLLFCSEKCRDAYFGRYKAQGDKSETEDSK